MLVLCEPLAQARVNIDIDLVSQTMRVAAPLLATQTASRRGHALMALGYAPHRRTRSLRAWEDDPPGLTARSR